MTPTIDTQHVCEARQAAWDARQRILDVHKAISSALEPCRTREALLKALAEAAGFGNVAVDTLDHLQRVCANRHLVLGEVDEQIAA